MRTASQNEKILIYLHENGSITPIDALNEFGCFRLASRISDLRRAGHNITRRMESRKNKQGDTVRYARYYMSRDAE